MSKTLLTLAVLLPFAPLAAQDPSLVTTTKYGVAAIAGNTQDADSVDARTQIGPRGLSLIARAGNDRTSPHAATNVRIGATENGIAVGVAEAGSASGDENVASQVGTIGNGDRPTFGPHSLRLSIPARPGTEGKVAIAFAGNASDNAGAGASVDVDGDGQADFAARADGTPHRVVLDVTAGRQGGIAIDITTVGHASARGATRSAYAIELHVAFSPNDIGGGHCEISPFGRPCGGELAGRAALGDRAIDVGLRISGAAASTVGVIALGDQLDRPLPLPGSDCLLLVLPQHLVTFHTDPNGDGHASLRLPARLPLRVSLQAITVVIDRSGLSLFSTNGLSLVCR